MSASGTEVTFFSEFVAHSEAFTEGVREVFSQWDSICAVQRRKALVPPLTVWGLLVCQAGLRCCTNDEGIGVAITVFRRTTYSQSRHVSVRLE